MKLYVFSLRTPSWSAPRQLYFQPLRTYFLPTPLPPKPTALCVISTMFCVSVSHARIIHIDNCLWLFSELSARWSALSAVTKYGPYQYETYFLGQTADILVKSNQHWVIFKDGQNAHKQHPFCAVRLLAIWALTTTLLYTILIEAFGGTRVYVYKHTSGLMINVRSAVIGRRFQKSG